MNDIILFAAVLVLYAALRVALVLTTRGLKTRLGEAFAQIEPMVAPFHLIAVATSLHVPFVFFGRDVALTRGFLIGALLWLLVRLITFMISEVYFRTLRGIAVPRVLKNVISGVQYAALLFAFLHVVSGVSTGDLLVIAAAGSLIAGITFQSLLTVFFVGLSTSLQDKFRVGDLVRIGDIEGHVVEISWRSTTIKTRNNDIVTAPNRLVAESLVINFHRPEKQHRSTIRIAIDPTVPPNDVKKLLVESAGAAEGVQQSPAPVAALESFGADAIEYSLSFWLTDYAAAPEVEDRVRTLAWYRANREGLALVSQRKRAADQSESIAATLRDTDIFSVLGTDRLAQLNELARVERFGKGEIIFREGEPGDSMYVVKSGAIAISVDRPKDGKTSQRPVLKPGAIFGERSLLTGERRSAHARAAVDTELIVIEKAHLLELMRADPKVAERISEVVVERDAHNLEATLTRDVLAEKKRLLSTIREFFAL